MTVTQKLQHKKLSVNLLKSDVIQMDALQPTCCKSHRCTSSTSMKCTTLHALPRFWGTGDMYLDNGKDDMALIFGRT